jgi:uncharacterized protein
MTLRNAMSALCLAAGCLGAATGAQAQTQPKQQDDEMVLVTGTVDCLHALRPVETAICSAPVLAAMDIQMITLYNIVNVLVKPEVATSLAAEQQIFLRTREACGPDFNCIGEIVATRINELDGILRDIASRGPY